MLRSIVLLALANAVAAEVVCTAATSALAVWCQNNCNHNPPYCPADTCTCSESTVTSPGCAVTSNFNSGIFLPWCLDNCYHNPRNCPSSVCSCSGELPFANPLITAYFLEGSQEVPPTSSTNSGSCFSWFAPANRANIVVRCNHTVSDVTAAHVHNNVFGSNGPIVHPFSPATFPLLNLFSPVTSTTVQKWLNGELYTNIHNPTNPGGNIRGQIARVANGATYYNFFLTAGEAGATGLAGFSGSCAAATRPKPRTTDVFEFIVACLHNIPAANVTGAVVGGGAIGSTGVNLFPFTTGATPFIEGRFEINPTQSGRLLGGLWFIRIDTALGSIRGQVVDSTRFAYPTAAAPPVL